MSSGTPGVEDAGAQGLVVDIGAEPPAEPLAVPMHAAREVVPERALTRLPGAPPWVAGLLNLRGRVVTVIDLAVQRGGAASRGPVVVVESDGRRFGLRVAKVLGVQALDGREVVDVAALRALALAEA